MNPATEADGAPPAVLTSLDLRHDPRGSPAWCLRSRLCPDPVGLVRRGRAVAGAAAATSVLRGGSLMKVPFSSASDPRSISIRPFDPSAEGGSGRPDSDSGGSTLASGRVAILPPSSSSGRNARALSSAVGNGLDAFAALGRPGASAHRHRPATPGCFGVATASGGGKSRDGGTTNGERSRYWIWGSLPSRRPMPRRIPLMNLVSNGSSSARTSTVLQPTMRATPQSTPKAHVRRLVPESFPDMAVTRFRAVQRSRDRRRRSSCRLWARVSSGSGRFCGTVPHQGLIQESDRPRQQWRRPPS